jgi:hypothetical protein
MDDGPDRDPAGAPGEGVTLDDADTIQEAIEVLKASGRIVEPWADDIMLWLVNGMLWLVDGEMLTDSELLALAIRLGLVDLPGRLQ